MNSNTPLIRVNSQKTVKEKIVNILSFEWPLTAKEIYSRILKDNDKTISYQAIHKTILQLVHENVLTKKINKYQLNESWIKQLKTYSKNLDKSYENKNIYTISKETTTNWIFDDISVFVVEMAKNFANGTFVGNGEKTIIGLLRHAWWPINFKFRDFNILLKIIKNNPEVYLVIQEDYPLDKWIKKQYEIAKMAGIKTGMKDLDLTHEVIIHGDSIIQIKFSEGAKKLQDEIYSRNFGIGDLFKEYARQKIKKQKVTIEVSINKNPELAKTMKSQLIKKFFGNKKVPK